MVLIHDGETSFSADDLALLDAEDTDDTETPADADDKAADRTPPKSSPAADEPKGDQPAEKKGLLAAGDEAPPPKEQKGYWPDDWRQRVAEHISGGDKKIYAKELRRLERITSPESVYGFYREAEGRLTSGGLIKVPGKDAKPEEIAEYHKALGVPETADEYLQNVALQNGTVIGDADKPLLTGVLGAMHKAGATQPVVDAMVNWYYETQEEQAAEIDESDDTFRRESENALKEEFGPSFKRSVNAIGPLFAGAPGGTDIGNDQSLYARLMGGRMADGSVIGNDPDMIRFLIGMAREVNPAATVTEDGDQSGRTIEAELADLKKLRTDDPKRYWSEPIQKRELELINAQERLRAKA